MNRLLTILLSFFMINSVKSQDYLGEIYPSFSDNIAHFGLEYFINQETGLRGYKKNGKIIIPAQYAYTQGFSKKEFARVTIELPNKENPEYVRPSMAGGYSMMDMMFNNYGLNGFIDTLGNVVIPIKYSSLGALEIYDVAPYSISVDINDEIVQKYGLINDKGEEILDAKYDFIVQYGKIYLASILKDNEEKEYFYLDKRGRELGRGGMFDKFTIISESYPKLFYVENNGVAYLIDQNFVSNADPYLLNGEDEKNVQKKLLDRYLNDHNVLMQEMKDELNRVKYSPNIK